MRIESQNGCSDRGGLDNFKIVSTTDFETCRRPWHDGSPKAFNAQTWM